MDAGHPIVKDLANNVVAKPNDIETPNDAVDSKTQTSRLPCYICIFIKSWHNTQRSTNLKITKNVGERTQNAELQQQQRHLLTLLRK